MTSPSSSTPAPSALAPSHSPGPLKPGCTIGILGGGQLGRMLALAAARLGLHAHIYCPNKQAPAFEVAKYQTIAGFADQDALQKFASSCDVVTFEFENIPLATADLVASITPLAPSRMALEISQDRSIEKDFLEKIGLPVANWWRVDNAADLARALKECGKKAVLKTRRLGYDGKGQLVLSANSDPQDAFAQLEGQAAVLEEMIPFDTEISVVLVRDGQKQVHCYDVPRNDHGGGILKRSTVPSGLYEAIEKMARDAAINIANALDYQGVLAVEFFVLQEKGAASLIVNEFAPRVHNTGHWTLDACNCDQFENHIRAVARWPLGATNRHSNAQMDNLLGDDVNEWQTLAARPDLAVHLYGKQGVKPGRKLGHATQISPKTK